MNKQLLVNQLIPFSNVDGEGNRFSIFLQGCNLSCVYCHNSETINVCKACGKCVEICPTDALKLEKGQVLFNHQKCSQCDQCIHSCPYDASPKAKWMSVDEIYSEIIKVQPYIRGITVSGGEATLQHEGITELFYKVKELNLTCYVDTNGVFDLYSMEPLIDVTDGFLFDVKSVHNTGKVCGVKAYNAIDNLKHLLNRGKIIEVRTVIVKDYFPISNTINTVKLILENYDVPYRLINAHLNGLKTSQKEVLKEHIMDPKEFEKLRGEFDL